MTNVNEATRQIEHASRVAAVAVVAELTVRLQADVRDRDPATCFTSEPTQPGLHDLTNRFPKI